MPDYGIAIQPILYLSLSEIEERHNGRLLVVLGIALQDLVDLLVILGGEIEGRIDIVVGRIIMLRMVPIDPRRSYLLRATHVAETHRGLLDQVAPRLHTMGASFVAVAIRTDAAERARNIPGVEYAAPRTDCSVIMTLAYQCATTTERNCRKGLILGKNESIRSV